MTDYELAMPFVTVNSKGGPHDDESYVCGFEMGRLDATLPDAPDEYVETIHATNLAQADLIAMRNGYAATVDPRAEPVEGWETVTFTRLAAELPT